MAGVFLTYVRYVSDSIWPSIFAHGLIVPAWKYGELFTQSPNPVVTYITGVVGAVHIIFYLIIFIWVIKKRKQQEILFKKMHSSMLEECSVKELEIELYLFVFLEVITIILLCLLLSYTFHFLLYHYKIVITIRFSIHGKISYFSWNNWIFYHQKTRSITIESRVFLIRWPIFL